MTASDEEECWQLVRQTALSRPPLTPDQREELAAIIRASRNASGPST